MAAELKLNVALDLAYFRQQLPKLAQAAAGYQLPLRIKFDRAALTEEIRLLSNQLGRRKYDVQINDSQIKTAKESAKKLVDYLNSSFKGKKWYVDIEYRETGRPSVPGGTGGRAQHIAGGYEYIRQQAAKRAGAPDITGESRRQELRGILERAKTLKEIKDIGARAGVIGISKMNSGQRAELINKIVEEAVIDKVKQILDPQMRMGRGPLDKVLDTFARGLFNFLGMDPAQMRRDMQARYRASLPKIDFPADIPQRSYDIGPSSSGRLLTGVTQQGLPGTSAFSQKLLLGDLLDPALKEVLRGAANTFVDTVRSEMNSAVRTVNVRDLGTTIRGALPPGAPPPSRPMLPGAGGTGGYFGGGRRPGGGYVPPGGFPSEGMATGPQGPKSMLSLDYYRNAFRYAEALKVADASVQRLKNSHLPLIGSIKGLAQEFGEATKQVLLYGTAYKGLAFLTSLPGQVLNAAKSQQQFANSMQVATQQTGTFAKEMLFVDNIQRAFGLNLDVTRQGFMRLYASMAPTGFDSGSIEKLFTGISAATAALQLTPDKAERVIYAFGQMASKGQVMSEELKGQLGDVLPGALSLFADAAGKSVQEFNKDLEDGVYKGEKFRALMTKVTEELITRFGTGAQAAGRSLQGLINTVGGDFQRVLESFAPLADSAAQAVLRPLSSALQQLGMAGQIAMGELSRVALQLEKARQTAGDVKAGGGTESQIRAAEQNVAALEAKYRQLNDALKDPAVQQQVNDIQKFVTELGKAGTAIMNMAKAIGSVLGPVLNLLGGNLTTVVVTLTSLYLGFQTARLMALALMGALTLLRAVSAALGMGAAAQQATVLAAGLNVLGVQATRTSVAIVGLRVAVLALVASTVVGAVVAGIALIAGAFAGARDRANEAAQASRDYADAAMKAAYTGNVAQATMSVQGILGEGRRNKAALDTLEQLAAQGTRANRRGAAAVALTPAQEAALAGSEFTKDLLGPYAGGQRQLKRIPSPAEMEQIRGQFGSLSGVQAAQLRAAQASEQEAIRVQQRTGQNIPTPSPVPTGAAAGDKEGEKLKKYIADQTTLLQLKKDEQLLEVEGRLLRGEISQTQADQQQALIEKTFEEKAVTEGLRVAVRELADERLSAGDKAKKEADLRAEAAQRMTNIEKKYGVEMRKILVTLEKPFKDAIKDLNIEMTEQSYVFNSLKIGLSELSAEDKAYIDVLKLTKDMTEAEKDTVKGLIEEYRKLRQEYYENESILKRQKLIGGVEDRIGIAMAPFGKERTTELMQQGESRPFAEGLSALEEYASKVERVKQGFVGLEDTIRSSLSGAITDTMVNFESFGESVNRLRASVAGAFKEMADMIIQEMIRAAIHWAVKQMFSFMMPGLSQGRPATPNAQPGVNVNASGGIDLLPSLGPGAKAANGAVWTGGFTPFASGGMVTGPTLGLIGEGRFNEAIVPLPDGKSIPVDLGGNAGSNISTNIVVNVSNGQASSQVSGQGGQAFGREIEGAVRQVILKETRPGGIIYNQR